MMSLEARLLLLLLLLRLLLLLLLLLPVLLLPLLLRRRLLLLLSFAVRDGKSLEGFRFRACILLVCEGRKRPDLLLQRPTNRCTSCYRTQFLKEPLHVSKHFCRCKAG